MVGNRILRPSVYPSSILSSSAGYYNENITIVNDLPSEDYLTIMKEYYNRFNNFEKIGSGSFSIVFGYKNYAIKFYTEDDCDDGEILHELGNSEWFPKLYFYNNDFMVVERIDGITVERLIYSNNDFTDYCFNPISYSIVDEVLSPLLEEKRYNANDIHNENLMVTKEGRIVIVDVGLFSKYYYPNSNSYSECHIIKEYIKEINYCVKRNKVIADSKNKTKFDKVKLHFEDGRVFDINNINIEFKLQF